ncbi:MAG: hypothetical protein LKKZDAJK_002080 [Candidatus Fervidibacter sp.]
MDRRTALITVTAVLVALFAAAHPNLDPDMWWHLAVGDEIVRRRSVHFPDPFSFTHPALWVNAQWFSELFFATLHRWVGVMGLEFLAVLLKAAAFLVVFSTMDAPPLTCVWVTLLFALGAFPTMGGVRPQLFSYLLIAALASWLYRRRQQVASLQSPAHLSSPHCPFPFWLPCLFALWANLHSFYPIAFALLLLAVFADAWNEWKGWRPALGRNWRRQMLMALALCLVAVNLTPFGWHSVKQILVNIAQSSQLPIEEWKPATAMRHPVVYLWAGLLLLWVAMGAWSPKRMDALEFLWGAFLTVNALSGVRMIALWCLLMAPFVARHIASLLPASSNASPRWLPNTVAAMSVVLALAILVGKFSPNAFMREERKTYPHDAIAWMNRHAVKGNCLTRYDWGGYVAWKTEGRLKVFVDGRADFYPLKVMRDFMAAYSGSARWRKVLEGYGVTLVLAPPDAPIVNLLQLVPDEWQTIYRDRRTVLLVRRRAKQPVKLIGGGQ